jgi:magnesium-transporting ATPase (P-type)
MDTKSIGIISSTGIQLTIIVILASFVFAIKYKPKTDEDKERQRNSVIWSSISLIIGLILWIGIFFMKELYQQLIIFLVLTFLVMVNTSVIWDNSTEFINEIENKPIRDTILVCFVFEFLVFLGVITQIEWTNQDV